MATTRGRKDKRPSATYKSRFDKWDDVAWVRSKEHQDAPFDANLQFFSKSLAILFKHSKVSSSDQNVQRNLLVFHLYTYLEFTVWLEMGPVNEVAQLLGRPDFLPWLPSQMKDDALKIYVDEGGHAQMSRQLMAAVERETGLAPLRLQPTFIHTLDALVEREEPEYRSLIKLFFVIISETLITGTLIDLPKDDTVQQAVRDLARDHASDEGRHHIYFRELFQYVWPRLPHELRLKVGILLPEMILAFLRPDTAALIRILEMFPKEFSPPGEIVEMILNEKSTRDGILRSASPTLEMLEENGVFDDPEIVEVFHSNNLGAPHGIIRAWENVE